MSQETRGCDSWGCSNKIGRRSNTSYIETSSTWKGQKYFPIKNPLNEGATFHLIDPFFVNFRMFPNSPLKLKV